MNDQAGATKVSLATQKVRLAVAMTGGVSLAVWMGGVAREINLLTQASDLRPRDPAEQPVPSPGGPPAGSLALQVRDLYRRLLELVDVTASVDVLSGTSAGGINAAVLGLANARRLDLGPLRDLWLEAGAFGTLLRNPRREPNPPSLLQGDGQLLAGIREGLNQLVPGTVGYAEENARATSVHITTTLLHGENGRFTDDYGNAVVDSNNRGLFSFSQGHLVAPGVVDGLALAARCSASFPVAFEPSFVPIGKGVDGKDEPANMRGWHPDMGPYANFTRSAWVVDGGLLANRPIGPLLRSVFARRSDREVRRVLLFVVPSTGSLAPPPPADFTKPYSLGEALRLGLDAALEQSIAADLDAIRRHNDQVTAHANTRVLLARLAGRKRLADAGTWADYRSVQTTAVAAPIVEGVTARMAAVDGWEGLLATGGRASSRVRAALVTALEQRIAVPPQDLDDVLKLGLPAYDSARAVALDLIRAGYRLTPRDTVEDIAGAHQRLNKLTLTPADLTTVVMDSLSHAPTSAPDSDGSWDEVLAALAKDILDRLDRGLKATQAFPPPPAGGNGSGGEANPPEPLFGRAALRAAWSDLLEALTGVSATLNTLADGALRPAAPEAVEDDAPSADADMPASAAAATRGTPPKDTEGMRCGFAELIRDYLTFLGLRGAPADGDVRKRLLRRLAELHAAERTTSPIEAEVEQRVELVQASAATRTLLDPNRADAHSKLTGVQLHHFGAFYKGTWRANDWMWGRLDGAGWLMQILLDPRRISAIIDAQREAGVEPPDGRWARWFYDRLFEIVGAPGQEAEALNISKASLLKDLAFLDNFDIPIPPSLPEVALWAALPLQRLIAAEELAAVAGQVRDPANGSPRGEARRWLGRYDMALTGRPPADIFDPKSIYERLVQAGVPKRKRISTFIGSLETLVGDRVPAAVREELGFLRKAEPAIPTSLNALQAWAAGRPLPATDHTGPPGPVDGAWVNRVAATLPACPIPAERLDGEVGTPLFTRTVTQTLAVATAAGTTTKKKPPVSLAPAISTARTATATAYLATRETKGDGKRLAWLGLLALGIGIASMFVSVPLVGAAGLVLLLAGAILLGVGLWRRVTPIAGLVVALAVILLAAAPWLPFLHDRLFSWLERTALPFIEQHAWIWTALFLLVLVPPVWMVVDKIPWRRRAAPTPQPPRPDARPSPVQPSGVAVPGDPGAVTDAGDPQQPLLPTS
jgi:patatin-related protein